MRFCLLTEIAVRMPCVQYATSRKNLLPNELSDTCEVQLNIVIAGHKDHAVMT